MTRTLSCSDINFKNNSESNAYSDDEKLNDPFESSTQPWTTSPSMYRASAMNDDDFTDDDAVTGKRNHAARSRTSPGPRNCAISRNLTIE
ncbi:hypothetical protein TSUD_370610 [Trifolium subterraneum]|uniref:Uncharacterized protein n=1 Tax=Trifolium subterraneum TaxID=3900 RepID=A0A2Z6N3A4_TRISU|nr:hypothetical protein TSUD_370610 [Trifolium subterraneum]